jgi:hypothetical protein
MYLDGDAYVRELATVGFLEDLQDTSIETVRVRTSSSLILALDHDGGGTNWICSGQASSRLGSAHPDARSRGTTNSGTPTRAEKPAPRMVTELHGLVLAVPKR